MKTILQSTREDRVAFDLLEKATGLISRVSRRSGEITQLDDF